MNIDGFTLTRSDRRDIGKERGGGVAVYINNKWCTQVTVKESFCNKDIEYLVISCRPFYLPREFGKVTIFIVYIPPDSDENQAKELLDNCVSKHENENPESVRIILGDFNHCDFQDNVPTYEQTVKCTTRGNNILDKMYCNIRNSYRVVKKPPLGNGDHNMLYCLPTYVQVLKREKCEKLTIRKWNDECTTNLQGCLECTDWSVLCEEEGKINVNMDIFNSYFLFCLNMIVPCKEIILFPNNKPWVNKELKTLLNEKCRNVQNGNRAQYRTIQRELNKKISEAKRAYKEKVEGLFRTNRTKDAWKGLKTLCGYNKKLAIPDPDNIDTYVNDINSFFARFDTHDFSEECNNIITIIRERNDERVIISYEDVLQSLKRVRCGKATGPDEVPARVIKHCAEQLAPILQQLFQDSLDQGTVPDVWKLSEIKPIAKVAFPMVYNDYRPIVLTSNIMKCFEYILRIYLCSSVDALMDPLQFAYCKNRCVQDASLTLMNNISEHLDRPNTQIRILYIDFSSAFNTIQPHILLNKLFGMGVNSNLLMWIFSYLSQRPQYTKIKHVKSNIIYTNTGAPQGCVLSPTLFTLYADDCRSSFSNCTILKYADDTAIVGKIVNDNCNDYIAQVDTFVEWCKMNYLNLNVKKTKEMVIDYRTSKRHTPDCIIIDSELVERVDQYKYLGIIVDNQMKGTANTDMVYKKCNQRLHFARILHGLNIDDAITNLFYKSTVESILSFSLTTWYGKLTKKDKYKLGKIVKKSKKMGIKSKSLDELYQESTLKQVEKIMLDVRHPLHNFYVYLRSGRRLAVPQLRTDRYKKSFVPSSILLFNRLHTT